MIDGIASASVLAGRGCITALGLTGACGVEEDSGSRFERETIPTCELGINTIICELDGRGSPSALDDAGGIALLLDEKKFAFADDDSTCWALKLDE